MLKIDLFSASPNGMYVKENYLERRIAGDDIRTSKALKISVSVYETM